MHADGGFTPAETGWTGQTAETARDGVKKRSWNWTGHPKTEKPRAAEQIPEWKPATTKQGTTGWPLPHTCDLQVLIMGQWLQSSKAV